MLAGDTYTDEIPVNDGYPIRRVANCFLKYAFEQKTRPVTPMKMQKLMYYLHGWHLASTDKPAIDGVFSVWRYGPVEERLYRWLKHYRNEPITAYLTEIKNDGSMGAFIVNKSQEKFYKAFDYVVNNYTQFSAIDLSAMAHIKGGPWHQAKRQKMSTIPDNIIRKYFIDLYNGFE